MILERITSALRERRILRLARQAIRAARSGDKLGSRVDFLRMSREIERRTPQQIERMERAQRLFLRRSP